MRVNQAFRFELDRQALARHAGAARFAYNWGLERCRRAGRGFPQRWSSTGSGTGGSGGMPPGGPKSPSAPPRRPSGIWSGP